MCVSGYYCPCIQKGQLQNFLPEDDDGTKQPSLFFFDCFFFFLSSSLCFFFCLVGCAPYGYCCALRKGKSTITLIVAAVAAAVAVALPTQLYVGRLAELR